MKELVERLAALEVLRDVLREHGVPDADADAGDVPTEDPGGTWRGHSRFARATDGSLSIELAVCECVDVEVTESLLAMPDPPESDEYYDPEDPLVIEPAPAELAHFDRSLAVRSSNTFGILLRHRTFLISFTTIGGASPPYDVRAITLKLAGLFAAAWPSEMASRR